MPINQEFFHANVTKVNPQCWDLMTRNGHDFMEEQLSFYTQHVQLSVDVYMRSPNKPQSFNFLVSATRLRNINRHTIYEVNKEESLDLNPRQAPDYMKFFMRFGDESSPRFTLVESGAMIHWAVGASGDQMAQARILVQEMSVKGHSGYYMVQAYAIRQRNLYRLTFGLEGNGTVTKMNEIVLMSNLMLAPGVYT